MTARPTIRTTGGDRLNSLLRQIRTRRGKVVSIEVGIFETAKYEDGTSVSFVGAIHQFGAPAARIPARPWFTNALPHIEQQVRQMVFSNMRKKVRSIGTTGPIRPPTIDDDLLEKIGAKAAGIIQQSIVDIQQPGLSQATLEARARRRRRKPGRRTRGKGRKLKVSARGANPLIDTGMLRRSITWKVRS